MSLPSADELLRSIDYDNVSALVLSALAVGVSDGKVSGDELSEITNTVNDLTGHKIGYDELWNIVNAAFGYASRAGGQGALSHAQSHFSSATAFGHAAVALAAAVAQKGGGIGGSEGNLIRSIASSVGVQPDSPEYFQLLSAGSQLART